MTEKDNYYHVSQYPIYEGERIKVRAEIKSTVVPVFSFESYKKTVEEKEELHYEKKNYKRNQVLVNELVQQIVNSPNPRWGGIKITV